MIRLPIEEVKRALANPEKHFTTLTKLYPLLDDYGDMRCFEQDGRLVVEVHWQDDDCLLECLLRDESAEQVEAEAGTRLQQAAGRLWLAQRLCKDELNVPYPHDSNHCLDVMLYEPFVRTEAAPQLASYGWVGRLSEGLLCVMQDDCWGYIDRSGREVIALRYDWADDFAGVCAIVRLDGCYGLIDTCGHEVVPIRYEEIEWNPETSVVRLTDDGVTSERKL